jgi:hypothetical protein
MLNLKKKKLGQACLWKKIIIIIKYQNILYK